MVSFLSHAQTSTTEPPNLCPRPQRNNAQRQEEPLLADLQLVGDFLSDNVGDIQNDDLSNGTRNKRKGRGITKKDDIFSSTPDMPKMKILLNDRGQPIGKSARQLSSVIGCLVRKKLSIACVDWWIGGLLMLKRSMSYGLI